MSPSSSTSAADRRWRRCPSACPWHRTPRTRMRWRRPSGPPTSPTPAPDCSVPSTTYPANGVQNCGQSVGNGDFDYWSYWHGSSGQWVYANNGPAEQSVSSPADDVEGWKFQSDEPATSSDPPPSVAPSYAQICNASTEVPPAQGSSACGDDNHDAPSAAGCNADHGSIHPRAGCGRDDHDRGEHPVQVGQRDHDHHDARGRRPGRTTTTSTTGDPSGKGAGSHGSSATHRAAEASAASYRSKGGGSSSSLVPGHPGRGRRRRPGWVRTLPMAP